MEKPHFEGENEKKETESVQKELIANSVIYLSSEGKKKEAASEKVMENIGSLYKDKNLNDFCLENISSYLSSMNVEINIPDKKDSWVSFSVGEKKTLFESPNAKLQIKDEEGVLEKNKNLGKLVEIMTEEAEKFSTPKDDKFKSVIVAKDNSLSIRMDPGSHKEFLGVILGDSESGMPHTMFFEHTPSGYEAANYKKNSRPKYISEIIGGKIDQRTKKISNVVFLAHVSDLEAEFRKYFRLCQSVKDLDLYLREEDVPFAVKMFENGATNMREFLAWCDKLDEIESKEEAGRLVESAGLSDREKNLLSDYYCKYVEEKIFLKQRLENVRKAKNLNFEIMKELLSLDKKAKSILETTYESKRQSESIEKTYGDISRKLEMMEKFARMALDAYMPKTDVKSLSDRLKINMEPISIVSRLGHGTPDALKNADGSVNVSEEGKKFLPQGIKSAYEKFSEILNDKGGKLETWDDVESLEEAVRFFHQIIVESPVLYGDFYTRSVTDSVFFREKDAGYPVKIVDLTKSGVKKSEMGKIVIDDTMNKLGRRLKDTFRREEFGNRSSVMIFSDDYFELSMPTEKHYLEMNSQSHKFDDGTGEYSVSLRYIESGYYGAVERQDFAAAVFEDLGFEVDRDRSERGNLNANLRTGDKNKWKTVLSKTIQLTAALKDLDLEFINLDTVDLFKEGVISDFHGFRNFKESLKLRELSKDTEIFLGHKMDSGADSEKRLIVNLLAENTKVFKSDFLPYVEKLDKNQLDSVVSCLFDLEREAKKSGNKSLVNKLHRLGDNVINLIISHS